jgi:hypothetical protein
VAQKLGMNTDEVDINTVDRTDFLRAEGELNQRLKQDRALLHKET